MKIIYCNFVKRVFFLLLVFAVQPVFGHGEETEKNASTNLLAQVENGNNTPPKTHLTEDWKVRKVTLIAGFTLIVMGVAQVCIGGTDYIFHIDHHDNHVAGEVFYDAHDDEQHLGLDENEERHHCEECFHECQEFLPFNSTDETNFTTTHLTPLSTIDNHALHPTSVRTLRQTGHVIEGLCMITAGVLKILAAVCGNNVRAKMLNTLSSTIQACSFVGTGMASLADFLHGHYNHAYSHLAQAILTLVQTVPNVTMRLCRNMSCLKNNITKKTARQIRKGSSVIGSFLDVIPSSILSILMRSPFYGAEATCNLFLGFVSLIDDKNNTQKAIVVTSETENDVLPDSTVKVDLNQDLRTQITELFRTLLTSNSSTQNDEENTRIQRTKQEIDSIFNNAVISSKTDTTDEGMQNISIIVTPSYETNEG